MPRYGFNFLWMYSPGRDPGPREPDLKALDFIAARGFDFVRIPANYWFWIKDFDYQNPDQTILGYFDRYLEACQQRGLHLCLNLHRAPGYCINRPEIEKYNLWTDVPAQAAFQSMWEDFARRYKGIPPEALSFDLVNEPPDIGQYGCTRDVHETLMRRVIAAIRAIDPLRPIVLDGLGGGNIAMPELADAGVTHSGRGYQPMALSHFEATWWPGCKEVKTAPVWPDCHHENETWTIERIRRHYAPWRALETQGVPVHIGEFGCYDHTPQKVALAWFEDLLSVFQEYRWGYSLWEFSGAFGIMDHQRPGTRWETMDGYRVDKALLDLLLSHRVK